MKYFYFKIILIFATTINSCCEYNTNQSTGNNTFSCYINGKRYVPSAGTTIGGGDIRPFNWGLTNFNNPNNSLLFSIRSMGDYALRLQAQKLEKTFQIKNLSINSKQNIQE